MNTPNDTISLQKGEEWTARWRKKNPGICSAFLIPKDDITGVLAEAPDAVRAYLGVEMNPDGSQMEKLIIVGCRLNEKTGIYEDMLPDPDPTAVSNGNYLYDFTLPCPPICDPKSSLS